jgi:hypothetical protein
MKKNKIINFLILESSKLIWLHDSDYKIMKKKYYAVISIYTLIIVCLSFLNIKYQNVIFLTNFFCYKVVFNYIKKSTLHKEYKNQFTIFVNELNLLEEPKYIFYKKIEFDKYIKLSPNFSSKTLKRYNKKFRLFPLVLNISKIPKLYNLYQKNLLMRYFNFWKIYNIKKRALYLNLGPFFGNTRRFFQFHNVKINKNNIEIKVEV